MSKADLARLVDVAKESILRDAEGLRKSDYNLRPHIFLVSTDNIKFEILRQTKRTKKLTAIQSEKLDKAVLKYTTDLYDTFRFRESTKFNYKVNGTPSKFQVLVTSTTGTSDVFNKIREIRGGTTAEDKGRLKKLAQEVSDIFSRDESVTPETLKHIFDLGHLGGASVAEKMAQEALGRFSSLSPIKTEFPELTPIINLSIRASEKAGLTKSFEVKVTDESYSDNRSKASAEKRYLASVRKAITDWVEEYGANWATQGGSRSALDIAMYELMITTKKYGAKVKGTYKKKSEPSKASTKIKGKKVTPKVVSSGSFDLQLKPIESTQSINWSSLVSIINSKLADTIIANMSFPGLQNRTGTFANSAKVVGVEKTEKGYPSFVFNYKRDPYDVFDTSLGRSPWNTPTRDPKTLIAGSIREIAKDLAIGRFYTRRA